MSENIDRRDFLKRAGAGALAIGTASLTGCSSRPSGSAEGSAGMETREAPKNGGKVSLLGYGCMRWPMKKGDGIHLLVLVRIPIVVPIIGESLSLIHI